MDMTPNPCMCRIMCTRFRRLSIWARMDWSGDIRYWSCRVRMRAARDRNRLVKASMNREMAGKSRAGVVTVICMKISLVASV